MDELIFHKRITKITISVILILIILLAGGSMIVSVLDRLRQDTVNTQMQEEAEEYRINILRSLDADLALLHTLAELPEYNGTADGGEAFDMHYETGAAGKFISVAYFMKSNTGTLIRRSEGTQEEISSQSLNQSVMEMLEKAFEGEDAISEIYYNEILEMDTYAYAVPVREGDSVVGVLAAECGTKTISDILGDAMVLSGQGYIHLIGVDGRFLILSPKQPEETLVSVFENDYIKDETERIRDAMAGGRSASYSFDYQGDSYTIYLEPLGLNGWYLFCVNSMQGISVPMYRMIFLMQAISAGSLLLVCFLLFYGYRLVRLYNKELMLAAYHDPLTGAYNLDKFTRMLDRILERSGEGAVMALNIRKFKFINEIFGREQGNRILCLIKKILDRHLAEDEFCCRDTADFFYAYFKGSDSGLLRQRVEEMIQEAVHMIYGHDGGYQIQMYCGVTMISKAEKAASGDIMTHTMFALAKAKETPPDRIWFYDSEVHKQEQLENYIESHMNQALTDGEFKLFLQPKMNLRDHSLGGAEALVRWITGNGRRIQPDQFVPIFERNGFCVRLDMYMTERVCIQIRDWLERGIEPIPISINQSRLMFYEADTLH